MKYLYDFYKHSEIMHYEGHILLSFTSEEISDMYLTYSELSIEQNISSFYITDRIKEGKCFVLDTSIFTLLLFKIYKNDTIYLMQTYLFKGMDIEKARSYIYVYQSENWILNTYTFCALYNDFKEYFKTESQCPFVAYNTCE